MYATNERPAEGRSLPAHGEPCYGSGGTASRDSQGRCSLAPRSGGPSRRCGGRAGHLLRCTAGIDGRRALMPSIGCRRSDSCRQRGAYTVSVFARAGHQATPESVRSRPPSDSPRIGAGGQLGRRTARHTRNRGTLRPRHAPRVPGDASPGIRGYARHWLRLDSRHSTSGSTRSGRNLRRTIHILALPFSTTCAVVNCAINIVKRRC